MLVFVLFCFVVVVGGGGLGGGYVCVSGILFLCSVYAPNRVTSRSLRALSDSKNRSQ